MQQDALRGEATGNSVKRLTSEDLSTFDSCEPGQLVFKVAYPQGFEVTPENLKEAYYKHNFFVFWAVGAGLISDLPTFLTELKRQVLEAASRYPDFHLLDVEKIQLIQDPKRKERGYRVVVWCYRTLRAIKKVEGFRELRFKTQIAHQTEVAVKFCHWCRVCAGETAEAVTEDLLNWVCTHLETEDVTQ